MLVLRCRPALAAFTVCVLLGHAAPSAAQPADQCTQTAMRSILSTFPAEMKIELKCELSLLSDPDATCLSEPTGLKGLEGLQNKLYDSITGACTTPNSEDFLCASTAAGQHRRLLRAATSQGDYPEPDSTRHKCRHAITQAGAKLAKKSAAVLRKCNERALAGDAAYGPAGPSCTDSKGSPQLAIARAEQKLRSGIFRSCGGPDRAAGGGDDFDPQDDLGFAETCRGGPDCVAPVPGLAELADCVICAAAQEVGEATTGALALPLDPIQSCRIRLNREYTDLVGDSLEERWRCELDVIEGREAPPCPSAATLAQIELKEDEAAAVIAASCSSLDPQDDVGFPSTCPDIGACAAIDVAEFAGLVECLHCVTAVRTQAIVSSVAPVSAAEPDSMKRDCRGTIGRVMARGTGMLTRTKVRLEQCDRGRDCGITPDPCPDEYATSEIEVARQQAYGKLLEGCSGLDAESCELDLESCGLIDPQELGFAATCPDILSCGAQETDTFLGLTSCLQCLAEATAYDLHDLYSPWP